MEAMGLEPMTSRVWGERSSRLSYASIAIIIALSGKNARSFWKRPKNTETLCLSAFPYFYKERNPILNQKPRRKERSSESSLHCNQDCNQNLSATSNNSIIRWRLSSEEFK